MTASPTQPISPNWSPAAPRQPDVTGHLRIMLLGAGAAFLALLDVTVTNLAIPDLARDFPTANVRGLSWVLTLYAVLFAALLTPTGRLADIVGRRGLYIGGVTAFTLASVACAAAPSLPALLAFRAVQGGAAAAMVPASLAIILTDIPVGRRAASVGLWTAAGALAAAAGPSIGGVLVDAFGWRSLFVINVPIGLALALGARPLRGTASVPSAPRGVDVRLTRGLPDLLGTAALAAGVGLAVLAVAEGNTWGWTAPAFLACVTGGTALVALTLRRSRRHPVPAVETSLWRDPIFVRANAASAFYGASLYPMFLVGVLFLTHVWHYSELRAGLAVSPGAGTATLAAITIGRMRSRRSAQIAVTAGGATIAAAGLWLCLALPDQPHFLTFWLPAGLLGGLGMGAVTTGTASAAALSVAPASFAAATGLNMTGRQIGGALGVAALATILSSATTPAIADYRHVYLLCTCAAVATALAGTGLALPAGERG